MLSKITQLYYKLKHTLMYYYLTYRINKLRKNIKNKEYCVSVKRQPDGSITTELLHEKDLDTPCHSFHLSHYLKEQIELKKKRRIVLRLKPDL